MHATLTQVYGISCCNCFPKYEAIVHARSFSRKEEKLSVRKSFETLTKIVVYICGVLVI